ncbi:MAG: hypothetical protein ACKN9K_20010, partial [Dolichospermum sp.]
MSDISMQNSEEWLQNLLLLMGLSTQVRANLETNQASEQDTPTGESYWLTIDQTNLTSEQIISQLEQKLGADSQLVEVAKQVAGGAQFPLKFPIPEGVSFTGFRDYFCEILQPMALQNGQFKGNAGEAA